MTAAFLQPEELVMIASKTHSILFLLFLQFLFGSPQCPGGQLPSLLLSIAMASQADQNTGLDAGPALRPPWEEAWRGIPPLFTPV